MSLLAGRQGDDGTTGGRPANSATRREVLGSAVVAVLSLAVAGGALVIGCCTIALVSGAAVFAWGGGELAAKRVPVTAMQLRSSVTARLEGSAVRIASLDPEGRLLMTAPVRLDAADHQYLEYDLRGLHEDAAVFLIWRTAAEPGRLHSLPLVNNLTGPAILSVGAAPGWKGTVTEIGIDLYSWRAEQDLAIGDLVLWPASLRAWLRYQLSGWLAVTPWDQTSINVLPGRIDPGTFSPIVFAAAWVALGSGVAVLIIRRYEFSARLSCLFIVVCVWMSLDRVWSAKLSARLELAAAQFAGKSQQERQLVGYDGNLYRYALKLREQLGSGVATVYILKEAAGHDYQRLRLQYHLLPHNIYNFGSHPPLPGVAAGDFLLLLGDIPGLVHDAAGGTLSWGGNHRLVVERIGDDAFGALFRVRESVAGG